MDHLNEALCMVRILFNGGETDRAGRGMVRPALTEEQRERERLRYLRIVGATLPDPSGTAASPFECPHCRGYSATCDHSTD